MSIDYILQHHDNFRIIDDKMCKHEDVTNFDNGNNYCKICGTFQERDTSIPCEHTKYTTNEDGVKYCLDCGQEVATLDYSPEWRYFGAQDNRMKKDNSRCHNFKAQPKSIKAVFDKFKIDIPFALLVIVEDKFNQVLIKNNSKILRGEGRNAIIAACYFFVLQLYYEYRPAEYIAQMFELSQKKMSEGLSKYYVAFPNDRTNHITPVKLIPWIMKCVGVDNSHQANIIQLHKYLANASQSIKRGAPQSVAAAVVYFYLSIKPYDQYKKSLGITRENYPRKVRGPGSKIFEIVEDIAKVSGVTKDEWDGK